MIDLEIKQDFITKDECAELVEWAKESKPLLIENPAGPNRFFNNIKRLPNNALLKEVQKRVLSAYKLSDVDKVDGFIGSILGFQTEGGFVQHHTDKIKDKRHLRFNLFLSVPESGGIPIYNGKEIPIKERILIPYEADKYIHASTPVVGNKPRIVISFGWAFDSTIKIIEQ